MSTGFMAGVPRLVCEDGRSLFQNTVDVCPVNAKPKAEQWPMLVIEAELRDFEERKHFKYLLSSIVYSHFH